MVDNNSVRATGYGRPYISN